jgi:ABC-type uncharacterized transport system involved in gliding motility auxiliary subunit
VNRLAALLGAIGLVAVSFGLLSVALMIFHPFRDDGITAWITANLVVGVLLLCGALLTSFDGVRQRLRSGEARRAGRYGSSALLSTVLGIAILGMLGYLTTRYSVRFDLSEQQVNTLTEQTRSLLDRLPADVRLRAFFQSTEIPDVSALLDRYDHASKKVTVEYVDPNSAPLLVESLGLGAEALASGLVRLELAEEGILVTQLDEPGLTNGLLKLLSASDRTVYFLDGHSERLIADEQGKPATAKDSMGRAAEALRNETYRVETLPMSTLSDIPENADAVIVAGPTRPYLDHEIAALRAYVARGGAVMVMLDPRAQTNIYGLLLEWGVALGDDVVVDQVNSIVSQPTMPIAGQYAQDHPITAEMRSATFFPMSRSVVLHPERGRGLVTIVASGPDAWAERDLDGWRRTGRAVFDEGDLAAPVPLAVAGHPTSGDEDMPTEPRLVVFGDSDFATNEYIEALRNKDLFVNSVNWLLADVEQIAVRPNVSRASRFQPNASQLRFIVYLSLFVLPETIALIGAVAWWMRRESAEA